MVKIEKNLERGFCTTSVPTSDLEQQALAMIILTTFVVKVREELIYLGSFKNIHAQNL